MLTYNEKNVMSNLAKIRVSLGFDANDMARELGIKANSWRQLELYKGRGMIDTFFKIEERFGYSIQDLVSTDAMQSRKMRVIKDVVISSHRQKTIIKTLAAIQKNVTTLNDLI